jgi:hypothetical protein
LHGDNLLAGNLLVQFQEGMIDQVELRDFRAKRVRNENTHESIREGVHQPEQPKALDGDVLLLEHGPHPLREFGVRSIMDDLEDPVGNIGIEFDPILTHEAIAVFRETFGGAHERTFAPGAADQPHLDKLVKRPTDRDPAYPMDLA